MLISRARAINKGLLNTENPAVMRSLTTCFKRGYEDLASLKSGKGGEVSLHNLATTQTSSVYELAQVLISSALDLANMAVHEFPATLLTATDEEALLEAKRRLQEKLKPFTKDYGVKTVNASVTQMFHERLVLVGHNCIRKGILGYPASTGKDEEELPMDVDEDVKEIGSTAKRQASPNKVPTRYLTWLPPQSFESDFDSFEFFWEKPEESVKTALADPSIVSTSDPEFMDQVRDMWAMLKSCAQNALEEHSAVFTKKIASALREMRRQIEDYGQEAILLDAESLQAHNQAIVALSREWCLQLMKTAEQMFRNLTHSRLATAGLPEAVEQSMSWSLQLAKTAKTLLLDVVAEQMPTATTIDLPTPGILLRDKLRQTALKTHAAPRKAMPAAQSTRRTRQNSLETSDVMVASGAGTVSSPITIDLPEEEPGPSASAHPDLSVLLDLEPAEALSVVLETKAITHDPAAPTPSLYRRACLLLQDSASLAQLQMTAEDCQWWKQYRERALQRRDGQHGPEEPTISPADGSGENATQQRRKAQVLWPVVRIVSCTAEIQQILVDCMTQSDIMAETHLAHAIFYFCPQGLAPVLEAHLESINRSFIRDNNVMIIEVAVATKDGAAKPTGGALAAADEEKAWDASTILEVARVFFWQQGLPYFWIVPHNLERMLEYRPLTVSTRQCTVAAALVHSEALMDSLDEACLREIQDKDKLQKLRKAMINQKVMSQASEDDQEFLLELLTKMPSYRSCAQLLADLRDRSPMLRSLLKQLVEPMTPWLRAATVYCYFHLFALQNLMGQGDSEGFIVRRKPTLQYLAPTLFNLHACAVEPLFRRRGNMVRDATKALQSYIRDGLYKYGFAHIVNLGVQFSLKLSENETAAEEETEEVPEGHEPAAKRGKGEPS